MSIDTSDRRLVTLLLVVLGVIFVVPLFGMGFGMMGYGPMMGGMWGGSTVPGWMLVVGLVMPLLFVLLLVGLLYLVYRLVTDEDGEDGAIEELRTAYARGDLTDEEYEERLARLREE